MPRGRPAKYPWAEWLDGTRHVLRQGDHFSDAVKIASFRAECHNAAKRKGGRVDTRIMGNTVSIRYLDD